MLARALDCSVCTTSSLAYRTFVECYAAADEFVPKVSLHTVERLVWMEPLGPATGAMCGQSEPLLS